MNTYGTVTVLISGILSLFFIVQIVYCETVTLINSTPRFGSGQTNLRCLDTGDYYEGSELLLNRSYDNGYGNNLPEPATIDESEGLGSAVVRWGNNLGDSRAGVYECSPIGSNVRVQTIKIAANGIVLTSKLSMTVNKGDRVDIEMTKTGQTSDPIVWRRSNVKIPPHEINVSGVMQTYTIRTADAMDAGIYETYPNTSRSRGASTRLIVRECEDGKWNPPLCDRRCDDCANGGVCDHVTGTCICPPGFQGAECEMACETNFFGASCNYECPSGGCQNRQFCLHDPYGCTCASGWKGIDCDEQCNDGFFGADCSQSCLICRNRADCDKHKGCICTDYWTGPTCQSEKISFTSSHVMTVNYEDNIRIVLTCTCNLPIDKCPQLRIRPLGDDLHQKSHPEEELYKTSTDYAFTPYGVNGNLEFICTANNTYISTVLSLSVNVMGNDPVITIYDLEVNRGEDGKFVCSVSSRTRGDVVLISPSGIVIHSVLSIPSGYLQFSYFDVTETNKAGNYTCQVTSPGGTAKDMAALTYKDPPTPLKPPFELSNENGEMRIELNYEEYSGDGPIRAVILNFKRTASTTAPWTIKIITTDISEFELNSEWLEYDTEYEFYVTLLRPGRGGVGKSGPSLRATKKKKVPTATLR